MPKVTVVKTGFKRLDKKLKKLTTKQQKTAFRKAARPAIKPLQQQSKQYAKDDQITGESHKAIKVRSLKRSRTRIGIAVSIQEKNFPNGFAGKFQELGWKAGRVKIEGNQPIKGAVEVKKHTVLTRYEINLAKEIDRA